MRTDPPSFFDRLWQLVWLLAALSLVVWLLTELLARTWLWLLILCLVAVGIIVAIAWWRARSRRW